MTESDNVIWGKFGHRSFEDAPREPVVDRRLSDEIIERLAVPPDKQALMRMAAWTVRINLDMSSLENVQFNNEAFWFITRPLRARYAMAIPIERKLWVGYLVENNSLEVLHIADDLAMEIATNFQLHPAAIGLTAIDYRPDPKKPHFDPPYPA